MPRLAARTSLLAPAALAASLAAQATPCSYGDYLHRLLRVRPCTGPTLQFSSYDRRSTAPGAPQWFANSDGFGREPIPGFVATLAAPGQNGRGRWLVAAVDGPGAIVRTWSAGMGGTLRVHLDGAATPLYEGAAEDFLCRKSTVFLRQAGIDLDPRGSFVQEEADYLPIPFARSLHITWEGRLDELHFYHVVVAKGAPRGSAPAPTFAADALRAESATVAEVHAALRGEARADAPPGDFARFTAELGPRARHRQEVRGPAGDGAAEQAGTLEELGLRCDADDRAGALRGTILRVHFDGASVPQIEAPLGDFFCSAPGVQPHRSLFLAVAADGWMTCRLPMPFHSACALELENTTAHAVTLAGRVRVGAPTAADADIGHLHAKWRVQHDLTAEPNGADIPYLMAQGQGVLVGVACLLVNPSGIPTAGGSWWGEGDEKIWVDGEAFPSTFGTGSEDFYNYAWSRPGLFAHPFCGQPTCTGPGTSGYVTNYRWLIADCVPFHSSLAFAMELKHHRKTPGFSYASMAYWYANAAAIDDHRAPAARDLVVPPLPKLGVVADGGAKGATIRPVTELSPRSAATLKTWPEPLAPNLELLGCLAQGGEQIELTVPVPEPGRYALHLVALHRADAAPLRAHIGSAPLTLAGAAGPSSIGLTCASTCVQDVAFAPVDLAAGDHTLRLTVAGPGTVGLDTLWWKRVGPIAFRAEGVLEAEHLDVVERSAGVEVEAQDLDATRWSDGRQLWVRARRDGDYVDLAVPVPEPGKWSVALQLTRSYDYGIVQVAIDGSLVGSAVDTCNHEARAVALAPVLTLPARDLGASMRLRLQVVGSAARSESPGRYFGIDWVRLERAR